jgi:hypothetical protein
MGIVIVAGENDTCLYCGKPWKDHGQNRAAHLKASNTVLKIDPPLDDPSWKWSGGYNYTTYSINVGDPEEPRPTPEDCHTALKNVLAELRYGSDTDKRWDVVITKLEEAEAYFRTYILCK